VDIAVVASDEAPCLLRHMIVLQCFLDELVWDGAVGVGQV